MLWAASVLARISYIQRHFMLRYRAQILFRDFTFPRVP